MATLSELSTALPTGRLLGAVHVAAGVVALAWVAVTVTAGFETDTILNGPLGAAIVAAVATATLLCLRPWKARSLMQWPVLWVAFSFLRLALAPALALLIYSATPVTGWKSLCFALLAAYIAVMAGETRVYALTMRRFAQPAPGLGAGARPADRSITSSTD